MASLALSLYTPSKPNFFSAPYGRHFAFVYMGLILSTLPHFSRPLRIPTTLTPSPIPYTNKPSGGVPTFSQEVVVGDIALRQSGKVIASDGISLSGDNMICDKSVMAACHHPSEYCHTSISSVTVHDSHFGLLTSDPALTEMGESPNHPRDTLSGDHDPELHDFTERAVRYCSNLGDNVDRASENPMFIGGNAIVYRGTLCPEGVAVAVKTVRFQGKSDMRVIMNICREAHVWSKLRHRNVLQVVGFTTKFDHTISLVSPWMERGNARDYVQNVNIDPRPLLVGIATGLQYLHDYTPNPIYHGDLKGANVLISDDGVPLLADFGYSYIVNSSFSMEIEDRKTGTLCWMAPEYFREDGPITAEGDIWAFGMTAVELFTRQPPFPKVNTFPKILTRKLEDYTRPSYKVTHFRLTDEWWKICRWCWDLDPPKRPRMSAILANIPMDSRYI